MNRTQVSKIWLTDTAVCIELIDGRRAKEDFADYSRLATSSKAQRENYRLSYFGIHWPDIDEDLSFDGLFNKIGNDSVESSQEVR